MKLGRLPYRHDDRTLQFSTYAAGLPTPPASRRWWNSVWPVPWYRNNVNGTCTVATVGHTLEVLSGNTVGRITIATDADAVAMYRRVCPTFDPATGAGDRGAVVLDVMKDWQKIGLAGHRLGAYTAVPASSPLLHRQAINLLGSCYYGVNLPQSALDQFNAKQPWTVVRGSPIVGGHAILAPWYNQLGPVIVTWNGVVQATWAWILTYCEEVWATFSMEWLGPRNRAPNGFNKDQLLADLAQL